MNCMNILFYGFRHGHIYTLYRTAKARSDVRIVACVEENEEAREKAAKELGVEFDQRDFAQLLQEDIDAVAIGGRYGDRGAAIIQALKAGKHVIADKPICTSLEELEEIQQISREKGLKIACMLDLRYTPAAITAKKLFQSKRMGEICTVSFQGQHCIDYPNRPSWYFEENMHGGTINDLAIHGIDLIYDIAGLEITSVDAARTWNRFAWKNPTFRDCAYIMARCNDGIGLLADTSYSAPSQVFSMPTYWAFQFWCEKGLVTFHFTDDDVVIYEEGKPEPTIISGEVCQRNWIDDFLAEIWTNDNSFTESVLRSSKSALLLQQVADQAD